MTVSPVVLNLTYCHMAKRQLKVTSRTHGLCMFVKAERDVELKKVYAYVQSTPLGEIRARQLWNVVVAYQFCRSH